MKKEHENTAILYRMVMSDHTCPYGLKAKDLLQRKGYQVDDRHFTSRDDVEAFKEKHGVETTPQIFIGDDRIGGFDDLRAHFGQHVRSKKSKTYQPVMALFAIAGLMALAIAWPSAESVMSVRTLELFVATAMVLLGLQKLQDVESFSTMFLNYDLLAQRYVRYGYVYPFIETGAGLLMLAGLLTWVSAPAALFAASIGAVSVFKAVYVDKRDLKCACVGGQSNVPLGFVSLTENVMMMGMAIWMLVKSYGLEG